MARPRTVIDNKIFENVCGLQCTLTEIASVFDCSEDTIERWVKREYGTSFAEAYKKFSAKGKMSLRRYQFELAKKSTAMAIFLGKNYLGQTDKHEYEAVSNGQLEQLIAGLKEPVYDLHAEATGDDGAMANE